MGIAGAALCDPDLGDRTEAQFFFEDFIDGVEDSEVCLEIEVVYGHFIFSGAAVDAACGYGKTERFGLFGAVREQAFFGEEGAEGGDADAPPVGDAACECEIGGFGGAGFGGQGGAGFGTDGGGTYWYSSDGQEFSGSSAGGFSDFFEQMFGHRTRGGGGANAGFRGQDFHADLNLSLRDAARTHKQILTVNGKNVRITIPAGVANGQVIKLKGYGGEGINGGPAGDLYITFVIAEDPVFKRLGDDLYVDVDIDLYTALLGGEKLVDTLEGQVKLKVKPGTQNNTKVRLKGKGFPVYKKEGQFGDLIVTYSIEVPTNLTEKQKELFREIQSLN